MSNDLDTKKRQITIILSTYYNTPDFAFLTKDSLDTLLEEAYTKYLNTNLSINEINDEIAKDIIEKKKKSENIDDISLNHKKIYSRLEELIKLLNEENIDYQLAGALSLYLKYEEESNRCHHDIDISVNEKDIKKLKTVFEKMNLKFNDIRFNSLKVLKNGHLSGKHEISALEEDSDFHIGVFPFERLADGTLITKGYYHDSNNNPCCMEDIISESLAKLIFEKKPITFKGMPVYITSPEYIYVLKSEKKSDKDIEDIKFLEDKINKDKLNKIKELSKTDKATQHSLVTNNNKDNEEEKKESEEELYTTIDLEKDMKKATRDKEYSKLNKEVTRKLKKIDPNMKYATGSISIVSIILALLVVFSIILVILIMGTIIK